ncbi:hypothetical protein Tco_1325653 [Tanacetum coccineum]
MKTLCKKIDRLVVNLDKTIEVEGGFYSQPPAQIFANQSSAFKRKYLAMASRKFKKKRQKSSTIGTRSRYRFYSGSSRVAKTPSLCKMIEYLSNGKLASNMSIRCVYESESARV